MNRKGLRPRFKLGLNRAGGTGSVRSAWRFRRSWTAISILTVLDLVFLIPVATAFTKIASDWGNFDSLFDVVLTVFLSAWLLGWITAPVIMTAILALMLLGRETLRVRPGKVELSIGLPFVGLTAIYEVASMRNLRLEIPEKKSGSSWRGPFFAFDYGANRVAFGSDVDAGDLEPIRDLIERSSGVAIRQGSALPGEAEGPWETDAESATKVISKPLYEPAIASSEPLTLGSASTIVLIVANLVPVAGTLFMGWNLSDVLVLYWAESAVIGFFNICKIILISRWGALFAVPFFLGHFGGFMAIHFLFIYVIFVQGLQGMNDSGGNLAGVAALFMTLWPALVALFVSHAYSFVTNFVERGEYHARTVKGQMGEPYSRIIFMQFVLILGGGLSMILGQTEPVLIAVIALKVYFDVKAHIKEHAPETTPAGLSG